MTYFGIDVSVWQGPDVKWPAVAASGIKFAFARASIGSRYDSTFKKNLAGMRASGILPGAYHYLYPGNGALQARTFLQQVGNPEGVLCVVDVEYKGLSYEDVKDFAAEFKARTKGHALIIYTGKWFWASGALFGNPNGALLGPLWHSQYVNVDGATDRGPQSLYKRIRSSWWTPGYGGWPQATVLQFSSMGSVPGVGGRCDLNAYRGEWDALVALAHKVTIPDTSTEGPMPYSITAGGLTLDSDYVLDAKKGTQLYDAPGKPLTALSADAKLRYFGQPRDAGGWYMVLVNTGYGYADKQRRPTLVFVKREDVGPPYRTPTPVDVHEQIIVELQEEIDGLESKIAQAKAALG